MLKWQKDGHLELMRKAAFSTTVEEEEKSLRIIQGGHYFIKWDGIKPREIKARHSQGWEWSGCGQRAWKRVGNGSEGRKVWNCLGRFVPCGRVRQSLAVQLCSAWSWADGRGLCLAGLHWPSASPTPLFAISAFCRTGNMAWRTLTSSKSARNNEKCFPWILSDYCKKENSGLVFRHHLCRERGTSSPLPLWNSCDPCWSGKAISIGHCSSSVKQQLKTFTNSVTINCWISLFLGWNDLKWKCCCSNAAQKAETSQVHSVWPLGN